MIAVLNEPPTEKGRVLVVDDDRILRSSIEGLLGLEFEVESAGSVDEALRALQTSTFDVVLTDYEMPGGNGIELVRAIHADHPGVMVILLTGHAELPELRAAESIQSIVRVLSKPFDPRRLVQWVANTIKLARVRQALLPRKK